MTSPAETSAEEFPHIASPSSPWPPSEFTDICSDAGTLDSCRTQANTLRRQVGQKSASALVDGRNIAQKELGWSPLRKRLPCTGLDRIDVLARQFAVHRTRCELRLCRGHNPDHVYHLAVNLCTSVSNPVLMRCRGTDYSVDTGTFDKPSTMACATISVARRYSAAKATMATHTSTVRIMCFILWFALRLLWSGSYRLPVPGG